MYSLFKKIVQKYPENIAIVNEYNRYNYLEFDRLINDCKSELNTEHKSVLIYLNRSEYLIAFQLAVNATKNVFTCLDIETPIDRVNKIINQLNVTWIISTEDFSRLGYSKKSSNENYTVWYKEKQKSYAKNISHIYFSSGSTGEPKGILLKSRPLINVVRQQAKIIGINQNKSFGWLLSPSFDASLSDIYVTLLSGAALHICNFKQSKIKSLIHYFKVNKITHSDISPVILPYLNVDELSLEAIIFGGEIANEEIVKNLSKKIKLYNAYGPTETTICSSMKEVNNQWQKENIGNPLKGVNYTILNNELMISGNHLAVGYLNNKLTKVNNKLTKDKFYYNEGVRYYKTGDLVEFKNNEYYYKGRVDRQFKHNGILIAPEEVENILINMGCIQAKCKNENNYELYYYGNFEIKEIQNELKKKLNTNMIPNKIIKLNEIITNINGKSTI